MGPSLPTPSHTHHLETIINDDLFLLGRHVKKARVGLHLGESRVRDWCRHLTLRPRPRVAFRLLLHCHVKCRSGPKVSSQKSQEGEGSWLDPRQKHGKFASGKTGRARKERGQGIATRRVEVCRGAAWLCCVHPASLYGGNPTSQGRRTAQCPTLTSLLWRWTRCVAFILCTYMRDML